MTTLTLIDSHPYLTFFVVYMVTYTLFRCWNRLMRHLNIRKAGCPPAHCDADGDFAKQEGGNRAGARTAY